MTNEWGGWLTPSRVPKYKITSSLTYRNGLVTAFLQGRWIDGGKLDRLRVESGANIPNSISDRAVSFDVLTGLNLSYTAGGGRQPERLGERD